MKKKIETPDWLEPMIRRCSKFCNIDSKAVKTITDCYMEACKECKSQLIMLGGIMWWAQAGKLHITLQTPNFKNNVKKNVNLIYTPQSGECEYKVTERKEVEDVNKSDN